jgi:hypothetical protein
MAGVIRGGKLIPVSPPFVIRGNEQAEFLEPDFSTPCDMNIRRKYGLYYYWKERFAEVIGGKFQGSNRKDFDGATTFFTVKDSASMFKETVPVTEQGEYKYFRYLSPDSVYNNMAELYFVSKNRRLKGTVTGSEADENNPRENAFDGDPLTYFRSVKPGGWIGLALDSPERVDTVVYQFRNDDNSIREGDEYELFYWKDAKWHSLGRQTGTDSQALKYAACPANALFLLLNHTRGREVRPFSYRDGKQLFW